MATQKGKFHISEKGLAVPCNATIQACPRVHGDSPESARQAYEQVMGAEEGSFAPAIKKKDTTAPKTPAVIATYTPGFKRLMDRKVESAEIALASLSGPDVQKHISSRLSRVEASAAGINDALPGTVERGEASTKRGVARAELVASDIALWRKSDYYTPEIENKMRETAENVQNADSALESSLADASTMAGTSSQYGIDSTEARSVLEYVHRDYLRPRGGLGKPLNELANDGTYVAGVAQQYRLPIDTVRGVILSASSKLPAAS